MTHPLQRDDTNDKKLRDREKFLRRRFAEDVRAMLATEGGRRVVFAFMQEMGVDMTPFSPNAMTQSHLIGKHDAAKWWVNVIRACCPDIERKMRVEAAKDAKLNGEDQNDDDE